LFSHEIDNNLSLELLETTDAEELLNLIDSNRAYLKEWLAWLDRIKEVNDTKSFIKNTKEQYASDNGFQAGIFYDNKLIGVIGIVDIDWQDKKTEIGYWIDSKYQGKGIITKSCKVIIDYAFNKLKLNKVEIHCAENNKKSQGIPKRLGFTKEGVLREAQYLYGEFVNLVIYGLLAREWE